MFKFFRQIRHKLMESGDTSNLKWPVSRYLKYAVGEIILVVIGILIALQINNWNTQRKNNLTAMYLLNSLQEDLENDAEELQSSINDAINTVSMSKALQLYYLDPISNPIDIHENTRYLVSGVSFDINNTTYNEMLNSGTINLLDPKLRKAIALHYWEIDSYDNNRDNILQLERTIKQLLIENGVAPFSINEDELKSVLKDPKLLAAIKQWEFLGNIQVEIHNGFFMKTQKLISQIEREINR